MEKISPDSFIVQHWCTAHGTALRPPDFKFKVESSHRDALSRQICEAVMIEETGILNSKSEFGMNHLCRMVTDVGPWKTDKALEAEVGERRKKKQDLIEFCKVMNAVIYPNEPADNNSDNLLCYRFTKYQKNQRKKRVYPRGLASKDTSGKKFKLDMDSSTPLQNMGDRREHTEIPSPPNISPVNVESLSIASDEAPSFVSDPGQKSATGNSRGMDTARITPTRKQETSADIEAGANNLFDSAMRTNALSGHVEVLNNLEASLMDELANDVSLNTWSGRESSMDAEAVTSEEKLGVVDGEITAGGIVGELNLDNLHEQRDDTAGGKVGELNLKPDSSQVVASGMVGELNLRKEKVVENVEIDLVSPVVDEVKNKDLNLRTPVRKRLIFGEGLTPEMGNIRATPGLSRDKRKNTSPQNTPESARRRRHTVSLENASELRAHHSRPSVQNTPDTRKNSTPRRAPNFTFSAPRRSWKTNKDKNQMTIVEMLRKQDRSGENENAVKGVKQLVAIDVNGEELKGTSVEGRNICPKSKK